VIDEVLPKLVQHKLAHSIVLKATTLILMLKRCWITTKTRVKWNKSSGSLKIRASGFQKFI